VVHDVPAYRYGLVLSLRDAGFEVHEAVSADLVDDRRWDVCVLSIGAGRRYEPLATLTGHDGRPVVAVLPDPEPVDYCLALDHGATGVIAHSATLPELVWAVQAALRGMILLPAEVARALSDGYGNTPAAPRLPGEDADWLAQLSRGASIAEIARKAGYSERQMYRRMQGLYRMMGARNRAEAIGLAARWGLTGSH
jgi:DNA-binding NarL/FixJ family response regulator